MIILQEMQENVGTIRCQILVSNPGLNHGHDSLYMIRKLCFFSSIVTRFCVNMFECEL